MSGQGGTAPDAGRAGRTAATGGTAPDARYVDVAGHPVRVRVSGPAAGQPVLLLHGIGRSLEDWWPAHDLLAREHRVISMDLPGFGLTRAPRKARPGLAAFARAAVGVLDALGERRPAYLMGNSLGGAVSMTVAAGRPDRVAGLVLAASAGFGREARLSLRPMAYAALAGLPVVGGGFRPRARAAGLKVNQDLFHDPAQATEDRVRHAAKVGRQPDFRAAFVATGLSMGAPLVGAYPGWRRRLLNTLAEARTPALVLWGDTDRVLPTRHFHAALAALPHAEGHLLPRTGHLPQLERPETVVALANDFLRATSATGTADVAPA
ncbi:alpha/beta fold hydrolase [Streptomyces sp. B1866]|uniref:alpha/beta fold hydrolase n=1 Tax=Streptomyces sp. B1866 TaxID=3075431 RepID=UPI0028923DCD|nr:alpha/beta fold hydrolase [Streptomyces sp. B1866]MDT3396777.1 alpha/beta fold hydrolase [Streptomyces sp. B1866]